MQRAAFELRESLEEDADESMDVLRSVFGGLDCHAVVCIRETDAYTTVEMMGKMNANLWRGKGVAYGWSRKNILASLFQPKGFQTVPFFVEFDMSMLHGPIYPFSKRIVL